MHPNARDGDGDRRGHALERGELEASRQVHLGRRRVQGRVASGAVHNLEEHGERDKKTLLDTMVSIRHLLKTKLEQPTQT